MGRCLDWQKVNDFLTIAFAQPASLFDDDGSSGFWGGVCNLAELMIDKLEAGDFDASWPDAMKHAPVDALIDELHSRPEVFAALDNGTNFSLKGKRGQKSSGDEVQSMAIVTNKGREVMEQQNVEMMQNLVRPRQGIPCVYEPLPEEREP